MPRPNRGPYLKLNKHGIYVICDYQGGKGRPLSTRTRDPNEAADALAEYIRAKKAIREEKGWLVKHVWECYWREHVEPNVVDKERLANAWKQLEPFFGGKVMQRLEPEDFEKYIRARSMWVADPTIRRELSALSTSFNHLVKTKRVSSTELPYIPLPANGRRRERWLTRKEIEQVLAAAEERRKRRPGKQAERLSRLERFLWIALHTGARRRVIERLRWSQVDLERGLIDFDDGTTPETKKRKPTVPISDALRPVLERAWRERTSDLWVLDSAGSIRKASDLLFAELGMHDVTRHTLRHTWATHASMAGVPLIDIARVLGNSVDMVVRVYAKFQPEYLRSAVNTAYGQSVEEARA